jgi:hypothetical protein
MNTKSSFARFAGDLFRKAVADYHVTDHVDAQQPSPYAEGSIEAVLYAKAWIDAVQWHLEDIIRDPEIDPLDALALKRRIDRSNQDRTDMVERLDDYFLSEYGNVPPLADAKLNTESPAWALDRLAILQLKIYHVKEQVERTDADADHRARCQAKLNVLTEQNTDLTQAIDELIDDYAAGRKVMKVYRQMKLYNDPSTNPVLYKKK